MILAETRSSLGESLADPRRNGARVALVPTMGYLHGGHLALVDTARRRSDFLAVSIFVNPLQFGPGEDLTRYPRDLARDLSLLEARDTDLVFHPEVAEMYPEGKPRITVDPGSMGNRLCGAFRQGHFRGVLTVVARLFGLFRPQLAVFGQKDFQQAALIRKMVSDLELGVQVLTLPTVREADGLAMSSRNTYLTDEQRKDAVGLSRALRQVQAAFKGGIRSRAKLMDTLEAEVDSYPTLSLQYGDLVHPETLDPVDPAMDGAVVAVAAFCGDTRLIDNLMLEE